MEIRCTCGAIPPVDARFCHKCGRPLFEDEAASEAALRDPAPPPPPPAAVVLDAPKISFRNKRAVGISLGVAAGTMFVIMLAVQIVPALGAVGVPFFLAGAGYLSVRMYVRQSGQPVSGASGARLGWMTGMWFFIGFLLLMTIFVIMLSGPFGQIYAERLKSLPPQFRVPTLNPGELATQFLESAIPTFFIVSILSICGGLVGSRLVTRR